MVLPASEHTTSKVGVSSEVTSSELEEPVSDAGCKSGATVGSAGVHSCPPSVIVQLSEEIMWLLDVAPLQYFELPHENVTPF